MTMFKVSSEYLKDKKVLSHNLGILYHGHPN